MSTYSSDLSETSYSSEVSASVASVHINAHKTEHKSKRRKRKHHHNPHQHNQHSHHGHQEHFDDDKLVKYYKYLYQQKCKESDHYKKLYRAKNKECEQLSVLNQQYQGRVITYLLENHTTNLASSYASSISRSSSRSDIRRGGDSGGAGGTADDEYLAGHDVDPINVMHDAGDIEQKDHYQTIINADAAAAASASSTISTTLNSVNSYDFVVDRYGNRTYNVNNKHSVQLSSSQLADLEAFPNDVSHDSKFTYYLLKAVYGTEVLASSSRTGRKCNSIKGAVSKPPLDQDLLHFIKSLFAQRVKCNYERLKKFNAYVNKKCSSSALFVNSTPIKASVVIKSEKVLYE